MAEQLTADQLMAAFIKERGDIFSEFAMMSREIPEAVDAIRRAAGYVHFYEGQTTEDQVLSGPMRELIALCQLCAKNDDRFAPNHVRRLYRFGITNRVMLDAALGIGAIVGWSTVAHVAQAIEAANNRDYPFGEFPEEGAPKTLTPFPELEQGRGPSGRADSILETEEWKYVAAIDPVLAERAAGFVDRALAVTPSAGDQLGPGPRELVAIAALCYRGEVEIAAQHIRRAYALGMTKKQVLEAISCVLPMTGAVTVQIGARAMMLADR
jgi:alkylhydroperoxidase/carboxymuconolactone decarboxylase family protein YurZ